MADHKSQYGIIGFFDILGYQSFLENNGFAVGWIKRERIHLSWK